MEQLLNAYYSSWKDYGTRSNMDSFGVYRPFTFTQDLDRMDVSGVDSSDNTRSVTKVGHHAYSPYNSDFSDEGEACSGDEFVCDLEHVVPGQTSSSTSDLMVDPVYYAAAATISAVTAAAVVTAKYRIQQDAEYSEDEYEGHEVERDFRYGNDDLDDEDFDDDMEDSDYESSVSDSEGEDYDGDYDGNADEAIDLRYEVPVMSCAVDECRNRFNAVFGECRVARDEGCGYGVVAALAAMKAGSIKDRLHDAISESIASRGRVSGELSATIAPY